MLRPRQIVRDIWMSPTIMTWSSLSIRIGGLALLLPLVLTHLETREVLVWQLLSTITVLVNLTDFGFSPTFSRVIAFARGGGTLHALQIATRAVPSHPDSHPLRMASVLATQRVVYRRLIGCAMALTLVGGTMALLQPIANLDRPTDGWISWLFTILACLFVMGNGVNVSILTGYDEIPSTKRVEGAIGAIQLCTTSAIVFVGGDLKTIVGWYSLWQIPVFALNYRIASRVTEANGRHTKDDYDPELFRVVWQSAWRSGLGVIMSAGIIQTSGLIYAQISRPDAAAAYLLALRLMTAISQFSQAPFYSKLPAMSRLRAEGRSAELLQLATRGMRMSYWSFVAGAIFFIIVAPYALQLIGSSVHLPNYEICALLSLAFLVERYSAMHVQLYSLTHHIVWHIANGATGALMISIFILLYPLFGTAAMPASMLLSYTGFTSWYVSRLSIRSIAALRYDFERATALFPAAALLVIILSYWLFMLF